MTQEELLQRISQLEEELRVEREENGQSVPRHRIDVMSSEVVDSNPYRCVSLFRALVFYISFIQSSDGSQADGHREQL